MKQGAPSMFNSKTLHARRAAFLCATAISLLISREAFAQEQQSPPLPPVVVEPPAHRPASVIPRSASNQRAKPRRAPRASRREAPARGTPGVSVTTPVVQAADGSIAAGYRVDTVKDIGPFTNKKLQDTPYSFSVLSSDFIQNVDPSGSMGNKVLDKSPFFGVMFSDYRALIGLGSQRGIASTFATNFFRVDGLPAVSTGSIGGTEAYDRIEIMTGVSGFMYGVNGNAGAINYVLKRPTRNPFTSVTFGTSDGLGGFGHVDSGGTTKDGQFGYRINAAGNLSDTPVDTQSTRRGFVSGAFDYRPFDNMLLQFDVEHAENRVNGTPPNWLNNSGGPWPAVPDSHKLFSAPWTFADQESTSAGTRVTWDPTTWFTLRGAFRYSQQDFTSANATNFIQPDGTYRSQIRLGTPTRGQTWAGYVYGDFKFDTGPIGHKVTVGLSQSYTQSFVSSSVYNVAAPAQAGIPLGTEPSIPYMDLASMLPGGGGFTDEKTEFQNLSIADDIKLGKYFGALLGVSYSSIDDRIFSFPNIETSTYNTSKATPTYAFLFKPTDWITTYVSYVEGLQQGLRVNDPNATNNGTVLPPYLREQYEIGAKATVGNTLLTFAYFDIDSALQYAIDNGNGTFTYVQSGRQNSKGVEVSATGKITDSLRVLGGFMFADARVKQNESAPATNGKVPMGSITSLAKVTAEYDLPFARRLTVIGGAYYTGGVYTDPLNAVSMPSHVTFDAGLRYTTKVNGHDLIARAYVSNLTDARYWIPASTSGIVGEPRRWSLSIQTIF
jgi:iron complex outermembrane receptor protein